MGQGPVQTIPNLPPATGVAGPEQLWINQAGVDRRATAAQLAGLNQALLMPRVFIVGPTRPWLTLQEAVAALGTAPGSIWLLPGIYPTNATIFLGQAQSIIATVPGVSQTFGSDPSAWNQLCVIQATLSLTRTGQAIKDALLAAEQNAAVALRAGNFSGYLAFVAQAITFLSQLQPLIDRSASFPSGDPVICVNGAYGAALVGICVDCNFTGATGIQYTSNNAPPSSLCRFQDVSVVNCHIGICLGNPSLAPDTNNYECDFFVIDGFQIKCVLGDTASIGIHHNSGNCNGGLIRRGNINGCNIGYNGVKQNGNMILEQFNAGSPVFPVGNNNSVCFNFQGNYGQYILREMETEGSWAYAINDQTALSATNIWEGCQFFGTPGTTLGLIGGTSTVVPPVVPPGVLTPANATILSMGNQRTGVSFANSTSPLSGVQAPAKVFSFCDSPMWTASSQVSLFGATGGTVAGSFRTSSYLAASADLVIPSIASGDVVAARAGGAAGVVFLGYDNKGQISRDANGTVFSSGNNTIGFTGAHAAPAPTAGKSFLYANDTNVVPIGRLTLSNNGGAYAAVLTTLSTTFANLPTGTSVVAGDRAIITDCNTTTFLAAAAGGGANRVPVFYNGSAWIVG